MKILKLNNKTKQDLLNDLLKRSPNHYTEYESRVNAIISDVRTRRDEAVFAYTRQFDGANITAENIKVTEEEIAQAYQDVEEQLLKVIRRAKVNIREYHEKQKQYSWFDSSENGIILGQKVTPLQTVGVYVPGGKAVYPSSVLMNVLPAKAAGVERVIMTTPPGADGKVYYLSRRKGSGRGRDLQGRRRAGGCGDGVWNRKHPEGRQNRRPGQYLCRPCQKSRVRLCQH